MPLQAIKKGVKHVLEHTGRHRNLRWNGSHELPVGRDLNRLFSRQAMLTRPRLAAFE
jgi:hypothetical protein